MTEAKLNGRHVAAIFVGAFTVIVGVNLVLAFMAVRTFPGLEVRNSYVASQAFDADRAAQQALGWTVEAEISDGILSLAINDAQGPVNPELRRASLGRPTHVGDDRDLSFQFDGARHSAPVPDLASGNWNLRLIAAAANGVEFRQRIALWVPR